MKNRDIDYKILSELIKNSKTSDRSIAKLLNVSQPTVTRRRDKLEKEGLLEYTAIPNLEKLGFEIVAFHFILWKTESLYRHKHRHEYDFSKEELEKFFRKNDSDEDGKLNEDELKVAVVSRADREVIEVEGPSVVEGQKAGIGIGYHAPDFELQPIEPYACLQEWLGGEGDVGIEKRITLSQLVGEQPVLLLFGSYT